MRKLCGVMTKERCSTDGTFRDVSGVYLSFAKTSVRVTPAALRRSSSSKTVSNEVLGSGKTQTSSLEPSRLETAFLSMVSISAGLFSSPLYS